MMIFTFICFVSYKWLNVSFHFDAWLVWNCWENHGPPQQHHRVQVVHGPLWFMAVVCRGTGCLMLGPGLLRTTSHCYGDLIGSKLFVDQYMSIKAPWAPGHYRVGFRVSKILKLNSK
ncbi:hypothetical protein L1987_55990 [Smallanthus sonchifolius]|uniref:Uncharacterized protein n=1 Tax=Smallanthus sonchifolius TaxID=185202 RepID=A0ACB9EB56_9ASTR|nr:hypothetical protein L1987_55990 [Smallanthus sonchifolius]